MKKIFGLFTSIPFKWDYTLFPILSGLMNLVMGISHLNFNITRVLDIDLWINSFMITFLTYMIFDLLASCFKIFQKYKYAWAALSFIFSTAIGGSLTYSFRNDLSYFNWICTILCSIMFAALIFIFFCFGASVGERKGANEFRKISKNYINSLEKMSLEEKHGLLCILEDAISINDMTFKIILELKDKKEIKSMISDIKSTMKGGSY